MEANPVTTRWNILIAATLLCAGCSMKNDDIIAAHKKCQEAGMRSEVFVNGLNMTVTRVTCMPRQEEP